MNLKEPGALKSTLKLLRLIPVGRAVEDAILNLVNTGLFELNKVE